MSTARPVGSLGAASGKIVGRQAAASMRVVSHHVQAASRGLFTLGTDAERGSTDLVRQGSLAVGRRVYAAPVRGVGKVGKAVLKHRAGKRQAKRELTKTIDRTQKLVAKNPQLRDGVLDALDLISGRNERKLLKKKVYRKASRELQSAVAQTKKANRAYRMSHSTMFKPLARAHQRARRGLSELKDANKATRAAFALASAARTMVMNAVTFVATAVMGMITTMITPVIVIVVVFSLVITVFGIISSWFSGSSSDVANVPSEYVADVLRAGSVCPDIPPSLIAAQLEQESGFNPHARSSAGAVGIAQFMPSTWSSHGNDGDGDGKADIENPHDAIYSQGLYMCELASSVSAGIRAGRLHGDVQALALAAYNAGLGSVESAGGVPAFAETQQYVARIRERMTYFAGGDGGVVQAGSIQGRLGNCDAGATSCYGHATGRNPRVLGSAYPAHNCTLWAYNRRTELGLPVGSYMGNGADWANTARRLGYTVNRTPSVGAVVVFARGQAAHPRHGGVWYADSTYGHVAVVEAVNADGSINVSEDGGFPTAPYYETLTNARDFEYIHN